MKTHILYTAAFTILLFFIASAASARNPFMTKKSPPPPEPVITAPSNALLMKIGLWQQKLNTKMSQMVRKAKTEKSLKPILPLMIIAFCYGVLHAAGPGHGKAVAASWLISRGRRIRDSVFLGVPIALLHGASGILLVLFLRFVIEKGVMGSMDNVTRTTQLVSFSLIAAVGAIMTVNSIAGWFSKKRRDNSEENPKNSIGMALITGIIPCPGVVLVMLFCLSMDVTALGILLALCLSAGMAFTISAVGAIVISGKKITVGAFESKKHIAGIIEQSIETSAALMVMGLGIVFLVSVI